MTSSMQPQSPDAGVGLGAVAQVSLYVRDADRAHAFYSDTLALTHLFTFGSLLFFDASGVRLYLHACTDEEWRPGSIVYFLVDDIEATYAALQDRGVSTTGAPHLVFTDESTGTAEWMAFFEDPDGNTLAVVSRVPA